MSYPISENHLKVERTARYFHMGAPIESASHIWFVLHGYGQLGHFFIQNFSSIANENTAIIAPEGLSRFYLANDWTRVGASWMTKEDRLHEIEHYLRYLDQVYDLVNPSPGVTKTLLGFSQGVATAWRWLDKGQIDPNNFVIWAGSMPEVDPKHLRQQLARRRVWIAIGDQDEYINIENARKRVESLKKVFPETIAHFFNDSHRIHQPTLQTIRQEIMGS